MALGPTVVTGATGFAGGHLLDRLNGRQRLVAWYRPGHETPVDTDLLRWRAVDLLNPKSVDAAVAADMPSRIYHLAGAPQVDSSWQTVVPHLDANVRGSHYLFEAVRRLAGSCRVLVVTSAQLYRMPSDRPISEADPFGPTNPYGVSKLAQDDLARRVASEDKLDVVIARPFNHAGPRQSPAFALSGFARQIALAEAGRAPADVRVGNLDAWRDFVDVRDVVGAYEAVMEGAPTGRAFNVASGTASRVGDLLDELLRSARVPMQIVADPDRLRPVDVSVIVGDATRLRSELGWQMSIPMPQTLADTLAWWRQQVASNRS
jgi:GDP-4-dehydro-6-deoxy-D-mannose reductase